jgi:hypothetical protein
MSVEIGSDDGRAGIARDGDAPDRSGPETVAAVDEIDGQPHLVVAEAERDGAWVAIVESGAVAVDDWE